MKATVWTSVGDPLKPRKCIFSGCIHSIPRVGEDVQLFDGYGSEHVVAVLHDLVAHEIEITVSTIDGSNDYPEVD